MRPLVERVHTFGPKNTLLGVVTLPPAEKRDEAEKRPVIVLLNAGLTHRAGPFRLGVHLARGIAERGFRVLRFDQSGLGDSAPNPERLPISEQIVIDAREAMTFMTDKYGAKSFIFGGLCSGAINAHKVCLADDRVVGMWLLDGYAYPTRTYYRHLAKRWLKTRRDATNGEPVALVQRIAKDLATQIRTRVRARLGGRKTVDPTPSPESVSPDRVANGSYKRQTLPPPPPPPSSVSTDGEGAGEVFFLDDWPPIHTVRAELEKILDRGANVLFIYTGGWSNFVDERQFEEMFPRLGRRGRVRVKYYPDADHTYVALSDRQRMFADVGDFIDATATRVR